MAGKFKVGDKVVLPATDEPGNEQPEEQGEVIEVEDQLLYPGMYIVQVPPQGDDDDGMREVHEDDMQAAA